MKNKALFAFVLALATVFFPLKTWAKKTVLTGIDVLTQQHFKCLQGKRVGLITNPTGVNANLVSTVDVLKAAPGVNLVALYGPEHGVRGDIHAGDKVETARDAKTGLPVFSLYGKTRKPTPEMLKDVDVLVYDIQDIGCRSFTFISTMGLAMEAAAESDKEFVVLDRPNPLGGLKIEGNITDDDCMSFVSQFKIPYIYGLTCGELARMLNDEGMLKGGVRCKLTVVKMKNWKRSMGYADTGLQWIASSPHIPQAVTAYYYPTSGILGELGYVSIGVGYTIPFQMFAAPWIDAVQLADAMNAHQMPGVTFRPIFLKPFYSSSFSWKKWHAFTPNMRFWRTPMPSVSTCSIRFRVLNRCASRWPCTTVGPTLNRFGTRMWPNSARFQRSITYINNPQTPYLWKRIRPPVGFYPSIFCAD